MQKKNKGIRRASCRYNVEGRIRAKFPGPICSKSMWVRVGDHEVAFFRPELPPGKSRVIFTYLGECMAAWIGTYR
jgi:hypothetical protein